MEDQGSQKCCTRCGKLKELSAYTFKDLAKRVLHSYCRECHAKWNRGHYERNKAIYVATARKNNAIYIAENLRRLVEYLADHPCVDCGERDPLVLDFDHRDPSTKRMAVGSLIRYGSWPLLEAEIAKCDVRCANDHRRRTAQQFGWRKVGARGTGLAGAPGIEPRTAEFGVRCST